MNMGHFIVLLNGKELLARNISFCSNNVHKG